MDTIFQIFRDTILNHGTVTNAPTQPTDIVNKQYVDNLPYVVGPSTSIVRQVPVFSNTTGNAFTWSTMTIDEYGNANITKNLTVGESSTLSKGAVIPTGYRLTLVDQATANTDAANKAYVDNAISINTVYYGGVIPNIPNSIIRWSNTGGNEITYSNVTITDAGLLVSPTISSVSGYQLGGTINPPTAGSFYLSRVGGTDAVPNVLCVGNTGYTNPVDPAGADNIFIGTGIGNNVLTNSGTVANIVIGNGIMSAPIGVSNPVGNVFVGNQMAAAVKLASYNVTVGYESGLTLENGSGNVLIGKSAGKLVSNGDDNVLIGTECGQYVDGGLSNVFIGVGVGTNQAVPIGMGDLPHTSGVSTVCIGYHADTNNHSNSIVLGTNARSAGDNCFTVGGAPGFDPITKWNCKGLTGMGSGATMLYNTLTGEINYNSSSKRYKTAISDAIEIDTTRIYQLTPRSFTWNTTGMRDYGLIAEETAEVIPELVSLNVYGLPETVNYTNLPVLMLAEMKKIRTENDNTKARLAAQEEINEALTRRLETLERAILVLTQNKQ